MRGAFSRRRVVEWGAKTWCGAKAWCGANACGVARTCGVALALGVIACGSDVPLGGNLTDPGGPSNNENDTGGSADLGGAPESEGAESKDALDVANEAPGYQSQAYPPGPYGIAEGATIENLSFLGWSAPQAAQYRVEEAGAIRLSDFYDPTGEKGLELLLINSVAVWCGVCRTEYDDMRTSQIYSQLSARGVEMLGLLFEDNDGLPARYVDMVNWGSAFEVKFPFGLDPAFKTGVYFDRSATPMNMLVDARTMEILVLVTGYNPAIYELADQILIERGR
jgi:AhpC/TSA family